MPVASPVLGQKLQEQREATLPSWTQVENMNPRVATFVKMLGLDDPVTWLNFATSLETPGAGAPMFQGVEQSVFQALAKRFPRFAAAMTQVQKQVPRPLGSLAKTIVPAEEPGVYELKPSVQGRLAHFYELGGEQPTLSNWEGVAQELTDAFGGDRDLALTWARLWGATSPNTSVPKNTQESRD